MGEGKEAWANKVGLVTLLDIELKEPNHGALMEFLNTFVLKDLRFFLKKEA